MLAQHDFSCERRVEHVSKAKSARRERSHAAQHARERDGCRARAKRGSEGGEGLRSDG